jgi:hypothetical protein
MMAVAGEERALAKARWPIGTAVLGSAERNSERTWIARSQTISPRAVRGARALRHEFHE